MNFEDHYKQSVRLIEEALHHALPQKQADQENIAQINLIEAMRYSLLAGGKRMRPVFLLEFCRACGGNVEAALPFACAIEMIHTYSLIHDDLPCMDDDDLRRGRATNHKVFGEAVAVLAGDALLNYAFETMFKDAGTQKLSAEKILEASRVIAVSSGAFGMVGGQLLDMENEGKAMNVDRIVLTYGLKTGAIIAAACEAGCILAGADAKRRSAATQFANALGLAFQITDDMLNFTSSEKAIGKSVGSDSVRGKMTYVEAIGIEACEIYVNELTHRAKDLLSCFEHNTFLLWFSDYLAVRQH